MHKALAVANKILEIAKETSDPYITPMQLIKLAYLSHGWMLGLHGRPLINESIEAWKYGPVVRSIYDAVKKYRDQPVSDVLRNRLGSEVKDDFDDVETDIIRQVYQIYGEWDGITLSNLTHMEGTPWHTVFSKAGQNAIIPNDMIENHFSEKYRQLSEESTA